MKELFCTGVCLKIIPGDAMQYSITSGGEEVAIVWLLFIRRKFE